MSRSMTHEDRKRRFYNAQKVTARVSMIDDDYAWVTCGAVSQRGKPCRGWLGPWEKQPDGTWSTLPGAGIASDRKPLAHDIFIYSGYEDTGYEVSIERQYTVHSGPNDITGHLRVTSAKGRRAQNGHRVGARPEVGRPADALMYWNATFRRPVRGQTVKLPAPLFCSLCGALNEIPVPDLT
jgi:hypothetical protein